MNIDEVGCQEKMKVFKEPYNLRHFPNSLEYLYWRYLIRLGEIYY